MSLTQNLAHIRLLIPNFLETANTFFTDACTMFTNAESRSNCLSSLFKEAVFPPHIIFAQTKSLLFLSNYSQSNPTPNNIIRISFRLRIGFFYSLRSCLTCNMYMFYYFAANRKRLIFGNFEIPLGLSFISGTIFIFRFQRNFIFSFEFIEFIINSRYCTRQMKRDVVCTKSRDFDGGKCGREMTSMDKKFKRITGFERRSLLFLLRTVLWCVACVVWSAAFLWILLLSNKYQIKFLFHCEGHKRKQKRKHPKMHKITMRIYIWNGNGKPWIGNRMLSARITH